MLKYNNSEIYKCKIVYSKHNANYNVTDISRGCFFLVQSPNWEPARASSRQTNATPRNSYLQRMYNIIVSVYIIYIYICMYISRSSIVIKTNYETRRRDRAVAGCRDVGMSGCTIWRCPESIRSVRSSKIQQSSTIRSVDPFDSLKFKETIRPDFSLRRKDTTTPSRDHPSDLQAIYVKSAFILLESLISVNDHRRDIRMNLIGTS